MKVFVPLHPTPDWAGRELARLDQMKAAGRSAKTNYIQPKRVSIREHIALAEKTQKI